MSAKIVGKMRACPRCHGQGWIHESVAGWAGNRTATCPVCKGRKVVPLEPKEPNP